MTQGPDPHINLYPELDDELDAAYAAHETAQRSPIHDALGVVASKAAEVELTSAEEMWADSEHTNMYERWHRYSGHFNDRFDAMDLTFDLENEAFVRKMKYFHGAAETLLNDPDQKIQLGTGGNFEQRKLELVAIPWGLFAKNRTNPTFLATRLITAVNMSGRLTLNGTLGALLAAGRLTYRHPDFADERISTQAYLDLKLEEDGNWGLALMQTGKDFGAAGLNQKSPHDLNGEQRMYVDEYSVDNFGIYEWLAFHMQVSPMHHNDLKWETWLLANRTETLDGENILPRATSDGSAGSQLIRALEDYPYDKAMPRLTVM